MANQLNILAYDDPAIVAVLHGIGQSAFGVSDLEAAAPYLAGARRVLDIGPGSGRCLDYFLEWPAPPQITAVEVSATLLAHLRTAYGTRVTLIEGNVMQVELAESFDIVLLMWSTLMEFAPEEQRALVARVARWLAPGGRFVVDLSTPGDRGLVVIEESRAISYATPMGMLHVYLPSRVEMEAYAQAAGLTVVAVQAWTPPVGLTRTLYVLENSRG